MHEKSDIDGIVARTRRIARLAGMPTALPEDDATVYQALFVCLGMIAARMELNARSMPTPKFYPGQQE